MTWDYVVAAYFILGLLCALFVLAVDALRKSETDLFILGLAFFASPLFLAIMFRAFDQRDDS